MRGYIPGQVVMGIGPHKKAMIHLARRVSGKVEFACNLVWTGPTPLCSDDPRAVTCPACKMSDSYRADAEANP